MIVNMDEVTKMISDQFINIITNWLSTDELIELRIKNKELINSRICATHDYCDANMAMFEAFSKCNIEFDPQNNAHIDQWNEAWNLAKLNSFNLINSNKG